MNTLKLKLALIALCGLFVLPSTSSAYGVTDATAIRLNDDTALFTITYEFGFLNRDLYMPIDTLRDADASLDAVSYEITSKGDALSGSWAPAIVLTKDEDVEVRNDYYYLPRGKRAEFTFVSIVKLDQHDSREALQLSLTNVPYILEEGEELNASAVRPEELPEYITPSLTMLPNVTIKAAEAVFTTSNK